MPAAARRRRAVAALPRVLRAAQVHHGRRRAAGQRAARVRQPGAVGGRAPRAARRGAVHRRRGRVLPHRRAAALPRRPPAGARRARRRSGPTRRRSSARSAGRGEDAGDLEADDLLGALARVRGRGRRHGADLHRRPRHVPVRGRAGAACCSRAAARTAPSSSTSTGVRERYGIEPDQVPGLHRAARRPVGRHPGRQGHRREDRGRAAARARRPRDARSPTPTRERPQRGAQTLREQADELREFRKIATLAADRGGVSPRRADDVRPRPPRPRRRAG